MGKVERGILNGTGYESWMQRRETVFCDEVEPEHVEMVDGEHVVWANRRGISETGFFDFHHIGCDHLGSVPSGESEIKVLLGCKAVQKVLLSSAEKTAQEVFQLDQILPHFLYIEDDELYLNPHGEKIAGHFVFEALAKTIEEPANCHGNIRSGMHVKPILKHMLGGVADHQIDEILSGLDFQGLVKHDDPFVAVVAQ